jgi:hypothetical protein
MKNKNDNRTKTENLNLPKPPSNRVLVQIVKAPRRPCVSIISLFTVERPYDWSVFGFDAVEEEKKRRRAIFDLMTEDEQDLFNKYCRLRDE